MESLCEVYGISSLHVTTSIPLLKLTSASLIQITCSDDAEVAGLTRNVMNVSIAMVRGALS